MTTLAGYDGRFGLRGWGAGQRAPPLLDVSGDDVRALRDRALRLIAVGEIGYAELASWNFELNDWVRIETFGARNSRAED